MAILLSRGQIEKVEGVGKWGEWRKWRLWWNTDLQNDHNDQDTQVLATNGEANQICRADGEREGRKRERERGGSGGRLESRPNFDYRDASLDRGEESNIFVFLQAGDFHQSDKRARAQE